MQVRTAQHDTLLEVLSASLRQQPPDMVREVSEILLSTYIEGCARRGLGEVFDRIVAEVEAATPSFVVVDSFRSAIRVFQEHQHQDELSFQVMVQRLALQLTFSQASTFLVGEYMEARRAGPTGSVSASAARRASWSRQRQWQH